MTLVSDGERLTGAYALAEHHDPYEKSAPEHHWSDWYAAYMNARQEGSTSEEASKAAGRYMEGLLSSG
jgi:hypothetical protein